MKAPQSVKKKKASARKLPDSPVAATEWDRPGLCTEAQADGVPCAELGRDCEDCEHREAVTKATGEHAIGPRCF